MSFSEQGLTQQELLKTNKKLVNKIVELKQQKNTLEQYLRIEKEASDETINELEQQNIQLQTEYNESRECNSKLAKDNLEFIKENANLKQQKAELINLLCERCDYIGACEVEEILCAVKKYK